MFPIGHMVVACGAARFLQKELAAPESGSVGRAFRRVDYRAVAFGSILPDLVDKPLVWFVLRNEDYGGHHIGHSLAASSAFLLAGAAQIERGSAIVFDIGLGSLIHVLTDSISHVPWSLLLPFAKLNVPRSLLFMNLVNVAGEIAGLAVLGRLLIGPTMNTRLARFLLEGDIED